MSTDTEWPQPALPKVRNLPKIGYVDDKQADRRFTRYKRHKPMPATVDNEYDPDGEAAIFEFLRDNPDFIDKPATMETFIDGKQYLNLSTTIRPAVKDALIEIFGDDVSGKVISKHRRAVFTGAIGVGKSTLASIAMCYMLHWTLCLKNPQEFFGLMPGSRIAFMIMSITDTQAKEVMFGDVKARITSSPWFIQNAPWDTTRKNQLRFPKDIWVLPGNSKETSFEGFNVLCGVIDEGDSHQVTEHKDYAQAGYETIENRITSRFPAPDDEGGHLGLLLVIGQMKSSTGFMSRMYKEMLADEFAAAIHLKQWESFGWQKYKKNGRYDIFWFDTQTYQEVSAAYARDMKSDKIIPIPNEYRKPFSINPVKALRDLAGIPPEAQDPFIAVYERVESAMMRWHDAHTEVDTPVSASCTNPQFHPDFVATDALKRVLHIDLAYSGGKRADSLGMAMGYVDRIVDLDGDEKPYIVFDFLMRLRAKPGSQIMLSEVRRMIYQLKEERGFRIVQVTVDGTNSVDMIQTLNRRHITANYLSVDKNRTPYEDLREAIYEKRVEFPAYVTETQPGSAETVVIAAHELKHLEDTGKKIDHAPNLSKDVADAMAAVVHLLTGSQQYRRGAPRVGGDSREDVLQFFGSGYDPNIHQAMQPIDVDFVDESGALQRALGGGIPKVPHGMPQLEVDPFGRLGLPRNI